MDQIILTPPKLVYCKKGFRHFRSVWKKNPSFQYLLRVEVRVDVYFSLLMALSVSPQLQDSRPGRLRQVSDSWGRCVSCPTRIFAETWDSQSFLHRCCSKKELTHLQTAPSGTSGRLF